MTGWDQEYDIETLDTDPTPPHGIERPAAETEGDETLAKITSVVATIGRWTAGALLWLIQYGFAVWCVLGWRLIKWSFKVLGASALLIFVPIVGWIALWVIYRGRKRDRQHRQLVETIAATSGVDADLSPKASLSALFRPWALDWVAAR